MIFEDDLPDKASRKPKVLDDLSIDELEEYIDSLKEEISRVEQEIKRKKEHGAAAAALFKKD